ncbi:hypothetical protein I3843_06G132000 [Carya illinoinensis]|nr:hypothetical protein I3843_06G132000 [Carya illinoinensis]
MLLDKLKDYKGEDLEVIHEACVFACETVEHSNDLLLPPYPSRPPKNSLHLENGYLPQFPSACKSVGNGTIPHDPSNEVKNISKLERNQELNGSHGSRRGLGFSISAVGKTVLTLIGVVSVLSLSGFGHNFAKKGTLFKVLGLFQRPAVEEKRFDIRCAPERVLVKENGEARCLVQ